MLYSYSRVPACALILLTSFPCLLAQTNTSSSDALLEGSVINKITGAPVKHARVMYIRIPSQGSSALSQETDTDGHFAISAEAGSYRLWADHTGFARQTYGSRTPDGNGTVLTLAPRQRIQDITLRIVPLGAIAGRVLDEDGEPIQGAGIQVLRFSFASRQRRLVAVTGVSSNDRGEYRAFGLPAGRYFLLANVRGAAVSHPAEAQSLLSDVQESSAALYYPGVLDFTSASQISLSEGGEVSDADIHAQPVHSVTLRGRLVDAVEDFANSQIQVVLARKDGNAVSFINRLSATVDNLTGRFEFRGIAPGTYMLVASQLYGGTSLSGRVQLEIGDDRPQQNVNVILSPAIEIPGSIQVEDGSSKLVNLAVRLFSTEGLAMGPPPSAKVGPDGSFRITGVTQGNWQLMLDQLPEGLWIKAASFGGVDVLRKDINIAAGAKGPLHIVLAGNGAQVAGTVAQDGQPGRSIVVLVPAESDLQGFAPMYRSTTTQENGSFLLQGVRPGAYKLFAFQDVEPFAWLDPDFLNPVESLGQPISIGEGEKVTRQLTAVPPEALLPAR